MSRKHWYIAIGASALLLLLLRKKTTAAATADSSGLSGGFTPLGIASIYFDPGQTYDINANTSSADYGRTLKQ